MLLAQLQSIVPGRGRMMKPVTVDDCGWEFSEDVSMSHAVLDVSESISHIEAEIVCVIPQRLFLGNASAAMDPDIIRHHGITNIISVMDDPESITKRYNRLFQFGTRWTNRSKITLCPPIT